MKPEAHQKPKFEEVKTDNATLDSTESIAREFARGSHKRRCKKNSKLVERTSGDGLQSLFFPAYLHIRRLRRAFVSAVSGV
ncbi:hypothetical protein EVAR_50590_1 [Eumeta japonica]|uniref:Uncharacterized protein n=1 Tax=Eumeta variegata TaxID=151549 RepID=A0A4C1Y7S8_EUMVA|nr:hypothetical protein EVAR_50590_1 [Eumeta japonica]